MNTLINKSTPHLSTVAFLLIIISVAVRFTLPLRDGDIWWHMMYGEFFWQNKTLIIDHTLFSWTPTKNDVLYCAWLPEIIFNLLYKVGGLPALFSVRYVSFLLFIGLFWRTAKKNNVLDNPLTWLVCLLAVHLSFAGTFIKPEIFSYMFMILISWNWWSLKKASSWKNCYLFPLIMLFWVNSHGAFFFGVIFLTLVGGGELMNSMTGLPTLSQKTRKHLWFALFLSAVALFLTPYGYHYPLHILKSIIPSAENLSYIHTNQAYMSPYDIQAKGLGNALLGNISVFVLVFLLLYNLRLKRVDSTDILINLCFVLIFTKYLRTTFFWAPVFAFTSIHLLSGISQIKWSKVASDLIFRVLAPAAFLLVFFAMLYQPLYMPVAYGWLGWGICENTPVEEARFIKKHYAGYNIGNTFPQGSYLLWELYPESRVSLDSRQFPYRHWFSDQQRFASGKNEYVEEFLEKYQAKIWCIDLGMYPLVEWFVKSKEWQLVFYGISSAVFVHNSEVVNEKNSKAGEGLHTLKNPFTALQVLTLAFHIQDWTSAELLVNRIEKIFTKRARKRFVREARQFYEGGLAYQAHDFERAVSLFKPSWQRFRNTTIPSNALLFLADRAWQKGEWGSALQWSADAFQLERNMYTIYNLAAVQWYRQTMGGQQGVEQRWRWKQLITHFLNMAPRNLETMHAVREAELILSGSFSEKPSLFLPPLPVMDGTTQSAL